MYLDTQRPGVEDIIDQIVAGVRHRAPTQVREQFQSFMSERL